MRRETARAKGRWGRTPGRPLLFPAHTGRERPEVSERWAGRCAGLGRAEFSSTQGNC